MPARMLRRRQQRFGDMKTVLFIQPADMPAMIRIVRPGQPTIVEPGKLAETVCCSDEDSGVRHQHPLVPDPGSTAMLIGGWRRLFGKLTSLA